jgi:hypothetical protein
MQVNGTSLKDAGLNTAGIAEKAAIDQGGQESSALGSSTQAGGYSPSPEFV